MNRKERREQQQQRRRDARGFQTALRRVFPTARVDLREEGLRITGPTGMQQSPAFARVAGEYGVAH